MADFSSRVQTDICSFWLLEATDDAMLLHFLTLEGDACAETDHASLKWIIKLINQQDRCQLGCGVQGARGFAPLHLAGVECNACVKMHHQTGI